MKKLLLVILFVLFGACTAQGDEPQQSTTGPVPPAAVIERDAQKALQELAPAPGGVQNTIAGVPGYLWRHGCGPTAVGMVVGYYDTHGYDDLIPGDANTQTAAVDQAIASSGAAPPYLHYEDYSLPIDSSPTLLTDAWVARGSAHTDDCIADYMDTSKSTRNNFYGWSWSSDICPSFTGYVNQQNSSHSPTCTQYSWSGGTLTWAVLTNEIDNNRPMVFLVDSSGNGSTDHFVTIVGYDDGTPKKYGCLDTWAPAGTVRWETFQGIGNGAWSIWGGWSFTLAGWNPSQVTKWEQLPDETSNGIDIRCDRSDGTPRILADDFECTKTGPINKVVLWGSWKSDTKGQIQKIHLSIHSNDPMGPSGWSEPNELLWEKDFTAADFNETLYMDYEPESFWDPTTGMPISLYEHYGIWQYDISIDSADAFVQQGDPCNPIVYWLDAYVELVPDQNNPEFGWKTSIEQWEDDAVYWDDSQMIWQEMHYPPGHELNPESLDLSFRIITGEEEEPDEPVIKWIQKPDLSENGMDIRIDRCDGIPRIMADDFECTTTGRITDVHFWGSWKYDAKETITKIHLSIHSDDPIGAGGSDPDNTYSKPDGLLWEMDFFDNDFTESLYYDLDPEHEWWWDIQNQICFPTGDTQVWKYDIYIDPCEAFVQEGTTHDPIVYWLDIYVETDGGPEETDSGKFGWKTSEEHWNDDAVYASDFVLPYNWSELRYPVGVGHPYEGDSIDMAFMITTDTDEPEQKIKWEQKPDLTETGIDVNATEPMILADDFNCTTTGDITKIVVWGSWLNDELPESDPNLVRFTLSIHSDMPVGDPCNLDQWSKPRDTLWYKIFDAGMFTAEIERDQIEEGWMDPPINYIFPADTVCWKYTFTIEHDEAFEQLGTPNEPIVYWLDVQAKPLAPYANFGWKTSLDHWNDDAVWGMGAEPYPGPWLELRYPPSHQFADDSIDLAFAIYTDTNEPNEPDYTKPLMAHTKWSQPPIEIDPDSAVPTHCGWDEPSHNLGNLQNWIIVADDFRCLGTMPVTSIHWWGSFLDWQENEPPLPEPNAWQIGFWNNVADPNPYDPCTFSHPNELLWQIVVDANQVAEPCLISYWKFNEGSGTIANDSENGNDGAISSPIHGITSMWTTGKEGSALYFHGGGQWNSSGDNVTVPHSANLDITGPFTVEAWIKATGTDHYHMIVDKHNGSAAISYGFSLCLTGGKLRLSIYSGANGNGDVYSTQDLRDNKWHHVAGLWDGNQGKIFVDGALAGQTTWLWPPGSTTHNLGIGKRLYGWGGYLPFEGKIDEVAIFNTNLSGDTIKKHYQQGLTGYVYDIEKYGDLYQHNLYLEPNDYFWQDKFTEDTNDNVFWLSIAAVYPNNVTVGFPWGWHTRPWHWMDDAVRFPYNGTLAPGITLDPSLIEPIKDPVYQESYDLAFELNTDPDYIKWEQLYTGIRHWPHYEDVNSTLNTLDPVNERLVADDWRCLKRTPITAITWWGSYIGYQYEACTGPVTKPAQPDKFKLTFWTDVPAGTDPCYAYSHPGEEIWEYETDLYDEVLVGYDKHPHPDHGGVAPYRTEPVFRYSVRLPEEKWFRQPDFNEVFWLSVQAIYEIADPPYLWGWTNHDHVFNDDAVQGYWDMDGMDEWKWDELKDQTGASEDMSFILFTDPNECSDCANYNLKDNVNFLDYAEFAINWLWSGLAGGYNNGDLDCDGDVDLADLDIFCQQWLTYCP